MPVLDQASSASSEALPCDLGGGEGLTEEVYMWIGFRTGGEWEAKPGRIQLRLGRVHIELHKAGKEGWS